MNEKDLGDGNNSASKRKVRKVVGEVVAPYYVVHYVKRRKRPRKMAIVRYVSPDRLLVVPINYKYYTQEKDFFFLERP